MSIFAVADGVLDALIVPSFTKIGPAVRRRMFDWTEPDVTGKRIAITGPTSGIGEAAARRLTELGGELILIARNPSKLDALVTELEALGTAPSRRSWPTSAASTRSAPPARRWVSSTVSTCWLTTAELCTRSVRPWSARQATISS